MSIGTANVSVVVNSDAKMMALSGGPIWARNLVNITMTGVAGTPENMVMMVYRGADLVALANDFTGPEAAITGSLDINTAEMETVFEDVGIGSLRDFDLFLYDSSIPNLIAFGGMAVRATRDYAAVSPIPPLSESTVFIGSFAFYNGKTYIRSADDGLYYEFRGAGTGSSASAAVETTGIVIPGAP